MPDFDALAAEFGLGQLAGAEPVPGHPHAATITTERGIFFVRTPGPADPALYEQVVCTLGGAGIRQATPLRTADGSLVSTSGLVVHEFLPGTVYASPTRAQTLATMRHVAAYHAALRAAPAPAIAESLWTRVASAEYLLAELPRLAGGDTVPRQALDRLAAAMPLIRALPGQLIHADIGPDNVLMDGDEIVAIVDFTPMYAPVLFAVATAVYWYHIHGQDSLDPEAMRASLAAAGPWTSCERAAWPAMLALEALRRYATPLALAEASPPGLPSAHAHMVVRRHAALAALTDRFDEIAA